jgi:Bardet-Biedl syndrome 1 protein
VQHTVVTALATIAREREGEGEASSLLLGTEAGELLVLDAVGAAVAATVALPAVPTAIVATGTLAGEHRIYVAARDGTVYAVRGGALLPARLAPRALPVALVRTATELVVACADATLVGFAPKGAAAAPLWSRALPAPATTLVRMLVRRDRGADCVLVALEGGALHVYAAGGALVAAFGAPETVVGAAFGQYGREANALALVSRSGALSVLMLRRSADLAAPPPRAPGAAPPEQDVPLAIPKKTRLALEQGARERDAAVDVHRAFQRGLLKLRLTTAKEYLRVLVAAGGPAAAAALGEDGAAAPRAAAAPGAAAAAAAPPPLPSLRVACDVLGLGPAFSLRVTVTNAGAALVADAAVVVECAADAPGSFVFPQSVRALPPLLPGAAALVDVAVEAATPAGAAGDVVVLVVHLPPGAADAAAAPAARASARPLVTALVHFPEWAE